MPGLRVTSTTKDRRLPGATTSSVAHATTSDDLKVVGGAVRGPVGGAGKRFPEADRDARRGGAFLDRLLAEARCHAARPVQHERAGMGDAVEPAHHLAPFLGRPRRVHLLIQEAVGADGRRARVGQEWNLDAVGVGEPREGRGGIYR